MASEVDVANEALALLGDSATVASFSPPDGSAQAGHCARFYPLARDELLTLHNWGFAIKRQSLALTTETYSTWAYAYAQPTDCLNPLAIYDPAAPDDLIGVVPIANWPLRVSPYPLSYSPQPFVQEVSSSGAQLILTNQVSAVLQYLCQVTDTTRFTPLFRHALARLLASKLAGPVLKGEAGRAESAAQMKFFIEVALPAARTDDSANRRFTPTQATPWLAVRQ